jgi:hypothetical protein
MLSTARACVRHAGSKNFNYFMRNRAMIAARREPDAYDSNAQCDPAAVAARPLYRVELDGIGSLQCEFYVEVRDVMGGGMRWFFCLLYFFMVGVEYFVSHACAVYGPCRMPEKKKKKKKKKKVTARDFFFFCFFFFLF